MEGRFQRSQWSQLGLLIFVYERFSINARLASTNAGVYPRRAPKKHVLSLSKLMYGSNKKESRQLEFQHA